MTDKIRQKPELTAIVKRLKKEGKRIVFTNGCFDILHWGHTGLLMQAREKGDVLIVAVNSDRSVRQLKGPQRPVVPEQQRVEIVASLESVDYVTVFDEQDPLRIISDLKPDILVKGGDWSKQSIVGADVVEASGGRVLQLPFRQGSSTTDIIARIVERFGTSPHHTSDCVKGT